MRDIPIEFCKEILGWPEAYRSKDRNSGGLIYSNKYGASFRYNDLRQVLKFAKWWCKKANVSIDLNCIWLGETPSLAIMKECLDTKRKIHAA